MVATMSKTKWKYVFFSVGTVVILVKQLQLLLSVIADAPKLPSENDITMPIYSKSNNSNHLAPNLRPQRNIPKDASSLLGSTFQESTKAAEKQIARSDFVHNQTVPSLIVPADLSETSNGLNATNNVLVSPEETGKYELDTFQDAKHKSIDVTTCRKCSHYNNIMLVHKWCCAGLQDRIYILNRLADLAGYFCARVYMPAPFQMFSADRHDFGRKVPEELRWDDFRNLTFRDNNGTPVFIERYRDMIVNGTFDISAMFRDQDHKNWIRLQTAGDSGESLDNRLRAAIATFENFTEKQLRSPAQVLDGIPPGFIWELNSVYYDSQAVFDDFWETRKQKETAKCRTTDTVQEHPARVDTLADQMFNYLQHLHPSTNHFGLLHIRRGDSAWDCDTSLEKLARYIACGSKGANAYGNLTILFASDEADPCYRSSVMDIIRQLGFTAVDLDATVLKYVQEEVVAKDPENSSRFLNNFFLFGVVNSMYWDQRMKFHLIQRRRESCDDCAELRDRISWRAANISATNRGPRSLEVNLTALTQSYQDCLNVDKAVLTTPNGTSKPEDTSVLDIKRAEADGDCRKCSHYNNIVLIQRWCCAGLLDRLYILERMTEIAGYFCAQVYMPSPYEMLSPKKHNYGKPIPEDLRWDDFWNRTVRNGNDTSEVIIEGHNETMHTGSVDVARAFQDGYHSKWLRIRTLGEAGDALNEGMEKTLTRFENFTEKKLRGLGKKNVDGFIWEIHPDYYDWAEVFKTWFAARTSNETTRCRTTDTVQKHSARVDTLADQMFNYLQQLHPSTNHFGLLHIRRGDSAWDCDTSLEKLARYIACGAGGTDAYGILTILFASDEADPCYRSSVMDIIRQLGFTAVDLDATVLKYVQEEVVAKDPENSSRFLNNFFLFGVVNSMYWDQRMKFHLIQRRRESCDDCAELRDRISWRATNVIATDRGPRSLEVNLTALNRTYNGCLVATNSSWLM